MKQLNQAGFTLVELTVSCVMVAIMSMILINFLGDWVRQNALTSARVSLLNDAQVALDAIGDNIRQSAAADQNNRWLDANAPGAPASQQSWQSDSSTLILATAAQDSNNNILFSDPANYTSHKNNYIYFVSGGILYVRTLAAPVTGNKAVTSCPKSAATSSCPQDRSLTTNATNFNVKYFNNANQEVTPTNARSIELGLTLQTKKYGQAIQVSHKTRMVFRNR